MEVKQLFDDVKCSQAIRDFVRSPLFLTIKDAFTAHTPGGDDCNEHSIQVSHGKNLGTRFVFNEMERIAGLQRQKEQQQKKYAVDPDLES